MLAVSTSFVPLLCLATLIRIRISGAILMVESAHSASMSPSPAPLASPTPTYVVDVYPPPGRPKRSVVWHYFTYDQDRNKSICQVEITRDHGEHSGPSKEACGATVGRKFPTNLKQHLRKDHLGQYQQALQNEDERGVSQASQRRQTADSGRDVQGEV